MANARLELAVKSLSISRFACLHCAFPSVAIVLPEAGGDFCRVRSRGRFTSDRQSFDNADWGRLRRSSADPFVV